MFCSKIFNAIEIKGFFISLFKKLVAFFNVCYLVLYTSFFTYININKVPKNTEKLDQVDNSNIKYI